MKRYLLLVFLSFIISLSAWTQVINFGKTLPTRAYSLTFAPLYNTSSVYHPEVEGMAFLVMGGYGLGYNWDIGVKYGYYPEADYFGADVQYLFRETRKSYYSFVGGLHKWKEYGLDLTVSYTHTPQYWINLTAGLDLDVDVTDLELRAWIPLNVGINFDDRFFLFFEYDLPANERAYDVIGGGMTFILR
jgi:opacity protein-like surface antigen